MEEQMHYTLMPSLKQRALIKTATMLWNQDDVRALTAKFDFKSFEFSKRQKEWQVVEDKVTEKVQVLPLPESLKNKVSAFIKQICLEVLKWWDYHEAIFGRTFYFKESLNKICWTPQGTVDKKKTAEAFVRDENLEINLRYHIACIYCLKNDILMLWNEMPEGYIKNFYSEDDPAKFFLNPLIVHWIYDVKGEMTKLENFTRIKHRRTPYQHALKKAVKGGNQVATEYFLQKLSSEEREEWLVRSARILCSRDFHIPHADVLCFLLSQMNEEQQIEVLKNHPRAVLSYLLYWPWQGLFMKMAKHVWEFLPDHVFRRLLKLIIMKVKDGFKDYDYQCLFREFWQQSPTALKENIGDICSLDLLEIKDKENIKLILDDLTTPYRKEVIFSTCAGLVCNDKMDLLEFFVQECLTAKDITIKFREEFEKRVSLKLYYYRSKETPEKQKDKWSKVFELLDDLTEKCDKRCVEDGNNGLAKRLCSLTSD